MKIIFYILVCLFIMHCNSQSPEKLWEKATIMRAENNLQETFINLESIIENFPLHDPAMEVGVPSILQHRDYLVT